MDGKAILSLENSALSTDKVKDNHAQEQKMSYHVIPKIIHYCWFGGNPKPELVKKCIESWKQFCPEYEIIEWNESNFDIHCDVFVEEAYQSKKWAFVSDYVRAYVLLNQGGIYLDTDMELLQSLDALLANTFFAGYEANDTIATCIIGSVKGAEIIRLFLDMYQNQHFLIDGKRVFTSSPVLITQILKEKGLKLNGRKQSIGGCVIYPKVVFCPTGFRWVFRCFSDNTIGTHHFMDSWGRYPASNGRTVLSKLRLSAVYFARNIIGTRTLFELGKAIRGTKRD